MKPRNSGAGSSILYDVRIGPNVIIGAGSMVTKDIPANSVAAGVPARVIGTFEDFVSKRIAWGGVRRTSASGAWRKCA